VAGLAISRSACGCGLPWQVLAQEGLRIRPQRGYRYGVKTRGLVARLNEGARVLEGLAGRRKLAEIGLNGGV